MYISDEETAAVRVRNGCKSYGKNAVLHQLDMTVPTGSTYALLGSSGCGKTTLLSSLVGLRRLDAGSVLLFGQDAAKTDITLVGYMPQETGLHSELRISEELRYFGRLYGLDYKVVEERIDFLVKLLQLPEKDPIIENLSGGETRRVSLAVALLHKPPLIILDEPTVGVDPLLRQSIWEHLYKLVKEEGATIILSTHYTEEARQADIVSVMRNGRLLVEESPVTLMERYNSEILEDIVVRLCRSQELEELETTIDSHTTNHHRHQAHIDFINIIRRRSSGALKKEENSIVDVSYKRKGSNEENKFSGVVVASCMDNDPANCQLTRRSSGDKLSNVVITQNGNGHSPTPPEYELKRRSSGDANVNNNVKMTAPASISERQDSDKKGKPPSTYNSRNRNWILRQLQTIKAVFILNLLTYIRHPVILWIMLVVPSNNVGVVYYIFKPTPNTHIGVVNLEQPNCFHLPVAEYKLGCELQVFLQESNKLQLNEFPSEESALAATQRGTNYGYIVLPTNFSRNMVDRVAYGRFADRDILDGSSISVNLDYSHYIRKLFLLEGLSSGLEGFVDKKLNDSERTREQTGLTGDFGPSSLKPYKLNEKLKNLGAIEANWYEIAIVPEIAWFMAIIPAVVSVTIVWDKKRGVFQRTIIGGAALPHLFLGTVGVYFIIFCIQASLTLCTVLYLNIPFKGSVLDFYLVNYGQNLVGLSYGFMLGMLFNQELEVIFCILALSITTSISNGGISSINAVDKDWVKWIIMSLPTKIPAIAIENIFFRGQNFLDPGVWHCLIVQTGWIVSTLSIAAITFYTGRF